MKLENYLKNSASYTEMNVHCITTSTQVHSEGFPQIYSILWLSFQKGAWKRWRKEGGVVLLGERYFINKIFYFLYSLYYVSCSSLLVLGTLNCFDHSSEVTTATTPQHGYIYIKRGYGFQQESFTKQLQQYSHSDYPVCSLSSHSFLSLVCHSSSHSFIYPVFPSSFFHSFFFLNILSYHS